MCCKPPVHGHSHGHAQSQTGVSPVGGPTARGSFCGRRACIWEWWDLRLRFLLLIRSFLRHRHLCCSYPRVVVGGYGSVVAAAIISNEKKLISAAALRGGENGTGHVIRLMGV